MLSVLLSTGSRSWLVIVWMELSIGKGEWLGLVLMEMGEVVVSLGHVHSHEGKGQGPNHVLLE